MGSKLKGTGVEFPDGTLQTTAARDFNVNYYDSDENLLANGVTEDYNEADSWYRNLKDQRGINDKIQTVSQQGIPEYNFNVNANAWTGYSSNIVEYREVDTITLDYMTFVNKQYNAVMQLGGSSGYDMDPNDTYKLECNQFFRIQGGYININVPDHMVAGESFKIMFDYIGKNAVTIPPNNYSHYPRPQTMRKLSMYIFSGNVSTSQLTQTKTYDERYGSSFASSIFEDRDDFYYNDDQYSEFFTNKISKEFYLTQAMVDSGKIYLAFENDINYVFPPGPGYDYTSYEWIESKFNIDNLRFLEQDPSNTIDGDDANFWRASSDGDLNYLGEAILYDSKITEVVKGISISPDSDTKRIQVYGTNNLVSPSWYWTGMDEIADLTTDSTSFPDSQIYDSQSLISGTSRYNYVWALNNNSTAYRYYCVKFYTDNNNPVKVYEVNLHPKLLTSTYEYHLISNDSADGVIFSKNLFNVVKELESFHTNINVTSSPTSGFYVDQILRYAIFYYAGNFSFNFTSTESISTVDVNIRIAGGGGGGAGGYQGDVYLTGCGTPNNGSSGGNTTASGTGFSVFASGGSGGTPTNTGYPGGGTGNAGHGQTTSSTITLDIGTTYTWTVGSGGSGGSGSGSLTDGNGAGGAAGSGGAGGTTGPGSKGGNGGYDGQYDAYGGTGGSGGGTGGAGTTLISFTNSELTRNMTGFGAPGMNGGGGQGTCSASDSGGGAGGGGGSNGYIIIEW